MERRHRSMWRTCRPIRRPRDKCEAPQKLLYLVLFRAERYLYALCGVSPAKNIVVWTPQEIGEWTSCPMLHLHRTGRRRDTLQEKTVRDLKASLKTDRLPQPGESAFAARFHPERTQRCATSGVNCKIS